ncbi:MAG TPA: pyrimidine dimer DNA glycosylase/endonuclease V [Microbacterium sp.]|nr:pyrimidine dimer DNA glycosylase/endonuclease V [Microbacterium sp.]
MRIWSLHPGSLDRIGLVACWRETLLAQAVLAGAIRGYRNHPQLERFRAEPDPIAAIGRYLAGLADEADRRGYRFDCGRILDASDPRPALAVTTGQLDHEWVHLGRKLVARSPDDARRWQQAIPRPHPLFHVVPGGIAAWERA